MREFLLSVTIVLFTTGLSVATAQESVTASGGEATGSGGSVSYSVGQLFYRIYTGPTGSVAEGVQQPYEISVITVIKEAAGIKLILSAFPNPATDYLILRVENHDYQDLSFRMFDINGRLITTRQIDSNETMVNMAGLPYGVYLLRVYYEDLSGRAGTSATPREVKTFRIVKH